MEEKENKFFWQWQIEEEEDWINEMARRGYYLERIEPFTYYFKQRNTKPYDYALAFFEEGFSSDNTQEKLKELKEMGIILIGEKGHVGYFRKERGLEKFVLSNNKEEKVQNLKKMRKKFLLSSGGILLSILPGIRFADIGESFFIIILLGLMILLVLGTLWGALSMHFRIMELTSR